MDFLLGPALRLILSGANFISGNITILNKGLSADLNSLIEGNLLIIDETTLSEVLFTFLFLLRFIVGDISGVTSSVIAMVTLNNFIIFSLLNHLNLVNTTLAISSRAGSSNSREADVSVIISLTVTTGRQTLGRNETAGGCRSLMVDMVVICLGIEGEGVQQRSLITSNLCISCELASTESSSDQTK